MLLQHIAVISETKDLSFNEVALAGAALQKQVMRDFGPAWNIQATVDTFAMLDEVPIDYWPIIIRDDIHEPGAAGIHLDKDGHRRGMQFHVLDEPAKLTDVLGGVLQAIQQHQ